MLTATLQKLSANAGDKQDSIQFRVEENEVEAHGDVILSMRRYDRVKVRLHSDQGQLTQEGTVDFPSLEFQSTATSISLCVTETGVLATITFSTEDRKIFDECVRKGLRNRLVTLQFEEGANPNKA